MRTHCENAITSYSPHTEGGREGGRESRPIAHMLIHIAYFTFEDIIEVICHINERYYSANPRRRALAIRMRYM